jgi:peptide/nickel transport system substrate-binding protein
MVNVTRRIFGAGALATGLAVGSKSTWAQGEPRRGGTLVATWGGGEPQACYVPSGGGSSPTFSSSKLFERLGKRRWPASSGVSWRRAGSPPRTSRPTPSSCGQGVKFHDGKPMTADDVVFSIDEIWKKYAAASAMTDYAGIEAPDASTVVMKFGKPIPEFFFASLLCGNVNYIVPKHIYAGSDPITNAANNAPIATGPWKFKEWVRGSHFEYVKNEDYWRKGFPLHGSPDHPLRARSRPGAPRRWNRARSRSACLIRRAARHQALTGTGKFVATPKGYEESVWSTSLECNMRNPIFAKREVRQAMFHAFDRNMIAKTVYYGYARLGTSPLFSPNKEFFTPDTYKTGLRSKKAASLLDAAGYPRKGNTPSFTLNLAGGRLVRRERQDRRHRQAGAGGCRRRHQPHGSRPADLDQAYLHRLRLRPRDLQQANPSEPVPATTQYYTSSGIKKGVPFRNASGFHTDEVDALVEKIKVETTPPSARRW